MMMDADALEKDDKIGSISIDWLELLENPCKQTRRQFLYFLIIVD